MAIRITGLNSGLDTESIISALVSSYNYKTNKYKKAQTKLSWKQDAWKTLNTKIYSLYKNVGNMKLSTAYNLKSTTVSDSTKVTVSAGSGTANGSYSIQVTSLAKTGYLTGEVLSSGTTSSTTLESLGYTSEETGTISLTTGGTQTDISVTKDSTIQDVVNQLKSAGVSANYDETNRRIYISATDSGADNDFSLSGSDTNGTEILTALGLNEDSSDVIHVKGQDSEIYVNGAKYTGTTNTFSINGLTITATGVTGTSYDTTETNAVSATVNTDTQGIYDKVKDFLTQYNALINEMTSLYNADSASGYEPLTSEEKDAMSDTEVELWESKIKSSLLRRDDTLNSLISSMTTAMSKSVEINGKSYSLSSFGIKTLGYFNSAENEQNAYHIDGDEDDSATSGNTDKLMTAIASDPDSVVEFMKQLSTNLYSAIDTKMKTSTLSSVYTVYNDKEMASEYSDYTDTIKKWEEKLQDKEDYYYEKFSAMETALAKLNSSSSALSGLLGS